MVDVYEDIRRGKIVVHVHGTVTPDPVLRFWAQLTKNGPVHVKLGRCWSWLGCRIPKGYGYLGVNGKSIYAHRFSYQIHHPKISIGTLHVLHKCDNPNCVNPNHLYLGTNGDNRKDSVAKKRHARGNRSGVRKINYNIAARIRRRCVLSGGNTSVKTLANQYRLSIQSIYNICYGVTWNDSGKVGGD